MTDSPYSVECERPMIPWRMALGDVDGETVVIILLDDADWLTPFSVIRLSVEGGRIVRITDYMKTSWILQAAASVTANGA
jgi:RNA polymerase sigma-70 factor, ECF subfamily